MKRRKVLLIGWDAADWKVIHPLMDAGKMPNVQKLVEKGAMGQIATLHPPLSPMLWTSIATGKRPFKHGIHGFSEPTQDGQGIQPVTNLSRTCKAVWNILNQHDLRSIVVGWWPSHPAEPINGVTVSDHYHRAHQPLDKGWPLLPNAVHPPRLAETLADLRMHPDLLTPEMVEPFIPLAAEIDQDKDKRLSGCMKTLCECVSMHSAATWLIENEPWDFFAVYYDAIDHFCHGFMKYHPPQQKSISDHDFELYKNVVSTGYQFHDQMLGTLLAKAGEDVTVILMSDHGFHPDHLRPAAIPDLPAGPAIEHRDFGILAISGPGIKQDELLHGASVLDITPTLLSLYGLPVGRDMDGKVLTQAFTEPPPSQSIPSWEDVDGNDGRHPAHSQLDPVAAHEALEQMIALGYIERPDGNIEVAVERTIRELRYNLGEAYQDDDRHLEALEIFRSLYEKDKDEQRYAVHLFVSCQALGLAGEMRAIVEDLDGRRRELHAEAIREIAKIRDAVMKRAEERQAALKANPPEQDSAKEQDQLLDAEELKGLAKWRGLARFQPAVVNYLKAQVLVAEKKYSEALEALSLVTEANLLRPGLFLQTADLYQKLKRWDEAGEVYRKALQIDPDNAHAHLGVCRMHLRAKRFEEAAESALAALQRIYNYPMGHYLLGLSLIGQEDYARAAESFRIAIAFNPNFPEAHVRLANMLERHLGDGETALGHRRLAQQMRRKRKSLLPLLSAAERVERFAAQRGLTAVAPEGELPSVGQALTVVTGLPRSGTSMLMQMLSRAGMEVLTDGLREPDEDNPKGYLEFEPVKNMLRDSEFLKTGLGKAVKVVAPLLGALPPGLPCRVILVERDLDEVLDSQQRMIERRHKTVPSDPGRRSVLKAEYKRTLARVKVALLQRPATQVLSVGYRDVVSDPIAAARKIVSFLGGNFDAVSMASAVDPTLHRNRSTSAVSLVPPQQITQSVDVPIVE